MTGSVTLRRSIYSKIELGLERVGEVWSRLQCAGSFSRYDCGPMVKAQLLRFAGLIADHAGLSATDIPLHISNT